MTSVLAWTPSYRIIPSRYPFVGIFDRIASPGEIPALLRVEGLTNDRVRDALGELSLVRPEDRISGPGTTPVMAAFTHAVPGRFNDDSFGVYYAARAEATAIAESVYRRARFLAATNEPTLEVEMREYAADVTGAFDDLRRRRRSSPLLDPNSYDASQRYGRKRYEANRVDGIVYPSVRERGGECVAAFRPRCIGHCRPLRHFGYVWDGARIARVYEKTLLEAATTSS